MPTNIVAVFTTNNLTLSWPAAHAGWQLQMQTNGLSTNWVNVANSALTNVVKLPIDKQRSAVFFRLIYAP